MVTRGSLIFSTCGTSQYATSPSDQEESVAVPSVSFPSPRTPLLVPVGRGSLLTVPPLHDFRPVIRHTRPSKINAMFDFINIWWCSGFPKSLHRFSNKWWCSGFLKLEVFVSVLSIFIMSFVEGPSPRPRRRPEWSAPPSFYLFLLWMLWLCWSLYVSSKLLTYNRNRYVWAKCKWLH